MFDYVNLSQVTQSCLVRRRHQFQIIVGLAFLIEFHLVWQTESFQIGIVILSSKEVKNFPTHSVCNLMVLYAHGKGLLNGTELRQLCVHN